MVYDRENLLVFSEQVNKVERMHYVYNNNKLYNNFGGLNIKMESF